MGKENLQQRELNILKVRRVKNLLKNKQAKYESDLALQKEQEGSWRNRLYLVVEQEAIAWAESNINEGASYSSI